MGGWSGAEEGEAGRTAQGRGFIGRGGREQGERETDRRGGEMEMPDGRGNTQAAPTKMFFENEFLFVRPTAITSRVTANYVRKPLDVRWGYTIGPQGQYLYDSTVYEPTLNPTGSTQFELHPSEQSEVVIKILMYAGIIIRDPQIVQAAAQEAAMNEQNEKL